MRTSLTPVVRTGGNSADELVELQRLAQAGERLEALHAVAEDDHARKVERAGGLGRNFARDHDGVKAIAPLRERGGAGGRLHGEVVAAEDVRSDEGDDLVGIDDEDSLGGGF